MTPLSQGGARDWRAAPQQMRVLLGESVYEDAIVTINNGVLWIEFESDDLDSVAVDLTDLRLEP